MFTPDLKEISAHYGGEVRGNKACIPTPGHSSRDRGTVITIMPGAPGGLLVHSFNGGDPLAIKDDFRRNGFLRERQGRHEASAPPNVDISALLPNSASSPFSPADDWKGKMSWDYTDADGNVLYRKKRTNLADGKKEFRVERPGGLSGQGDQPHVLYRLPELIDSVGPVFMAEGEKCADQLVALGFTATSSKNVEKCDLSPLIGRIIIVLPDNDDAGRRIQGKVTIALSEAGAVPVVVDLPGLAEKGDVVDWVEQGGTTEELLALVAAKFSSSTRSISATPFRWQDPSEIPTRPWLFGHWLLQGMLACLIAPGGSGKSTFLSALGLSVASGEPFLGHEVHGGPKNVWIWNLEDDLDELSRSILATITHHGLDRGQLADRLFVDSGLEGSTLCTATEGKDGINILQPVYDQLKDELIRRDIGLLIVDPFISSHQVDENSNTKIDRVAKEWARVAKAANCCILLAHHTSKAGAGDVNAMSARGAVALVNASRSALVINRLPSGDAERYGIEPFEARRYISIGDDKHNRAPVSKAKWFKIASVELGNGLQVNLDGIAPCGVGGDSVGVIEPAALDEVEHETEPGQILLIQEKVRSGPFNRGSSQAENWAGKAVAEVLDLCPEKDKRKIGQKLKQWIAKGYFKVQKIKNDKGKGQPFLEVGEPPEMDHPPT